MPETLKIEITVREDHHRIVVKTLEGEDAEKWDRYIKLFAHWRSHTTAILIGEV